MGIFGINSIPIGSFRYSQRSLRGAPCVLVCSGIAAETEEGQEIEVDIESALVRNLATKKEFQGEPLHDMMLKSLRKGGIMRLLSET